MKIRKAIIRERERFDFVETEMPALGPRDVLVKTKAVGLCHTDLPTFLGTMGCVMTERGYARVTPATDYPADTGHEPVGQVIEVGREVKNFKVGQWVSGMGGGKLGAFNAGAFSDYLILDDDERQFVTLPDGLREPELCCAEPLGCVVNMVRHTPANLGSNVAVVGCGFMGLMAIAGLRRSGADHITAVDLLDNKLELAKKYGATETINPKNVAVDDAAWDITGGKFYDAVIEITGSLSGLDTASRILRPTQRESLKSFDGTYNGRGVIVMASVYLKMEPFPVTLGFNLCAKSPELWAVNPDFAVSPRENMLRGVRAYADGSLPMNEFITHRFAFDDIQKGFEQLKTPDAGYIKGVVTFD
jgi:threonine dehydrogenase-like Zn-dependent dehydrogenase